MKIKSNYIEGIYRLFVLISLYPCFYGLMQTINYKQLRYVLLGFLGGLCVYFSFFILEWILSGFFNLEIKASGIRSVIYRAIDKLKKINYLPLFIYSLFLVIALSYAFFENLKILSAKDAEIENLKNDIEFVQGIIENPEELKKQLDYITEVKQTEQDMIKRNEDSQRYNQSLKMLNNLPIPPQFKNNYYYIETPVQQQRCILSTPSSWQSASDQINQSYKNQIRQREIWNMQSDIDELRHDLFWQDVRYERDHSYPY